MRASIYECDTLLLMYAIVSLLLIENCNLYLKPLSNIEIELEASRTKYGFLTQFQIQPLSRKAAAFPLIGYQLKTRVFDKQTTSTKIMR